MARSVRRRAATTVQERGPSWSRPSGSVRSRPSPYALFPWAAARASARATPASHPAIATTRTSPADGTTKTTAASASVASSRAVAVSRASRSGRTEASISRRTTASSASAGEATGSPGAQLREERPRLVDFNQIALRAERAKHRRRLVEMPLRGRARAGPRREAAERQLAEGGVIALAQQLEHVHALREVVVRGGMAAGALVHRAADAKELAPVGRRGPGIEPPLA